MLHVDGVVVMDAENFRERNVGKAVVARTVDNSERQKGTSNQANVESSEVLQREMSINMERNCQR